MSVPCLPSCILTLTSLIWLCQATLRVTRGLIRAVEYDDDHAVVMSDNTVGVWCLTTEVHLRTLQGDTVTCISSLCGNMLVTGSIDRSVKLWDLTSGKCLKAMEECAAEVTCVITDWKRGVMVTGDRKGNVRVWDLNKVSLSLWLLRILESQRCFHARIKLPRGLGQCYTARPPPHLKVALRLASCTIN